MRERTGHLLSEGQQLGWGECSSQRKPVSEQTFLLPGGASMSWRMSEQPPVFKLKNILLSIIIAMVCFLWFASENCIGNPDISF